MQAMKKRVVLEAGTREDPYEKAAHEDDQVSTPALKLIDFGRPCVRDVASSRNSCKLLSYRLCDHKSYPMERIQKEPHYSCLRKRRTCAVVGSSEHLKATSWGEFIDSHDTVIRINAAPAGNKSGGIKSAAFKLARHVGTRTDVRFVNQKGHFLQESNGTRKTCLFLHNPEIPEECGASCWRNPAYCDVPCDPKVNMDLQPFCRKGHCNLNDITCSGKGMKLEKDWGNSLVFLDNLHAGIADQVVPHSTAGFKAIIYAMTICEKVTVLGFGPSCSHQTGARYYEVAGDIRPDPWHHYEEELMLIRRAYRLGIKAMMPPEVRSTVYAKSVEVMLPKCVLNEALRLQELLRPLNDSLAVSFSSSIPRAF